MNIKEYEKIGRTRRHEIISAVNKIDELLQDEGFSLRDSREEHFFDSLLIQAKATKRRIDVWPVFEYEYRED